MRKYLRKLSESILDEHNLFVELLLLWTAGMVTLLVFFVVLGSCA